MKKITIALVQVVLVFLSSVVTAGQGLKIGDKSPDLKLKNVLNEPTGVLSLEDYRGKLLILDFWSTGCLGCLQSFAKTDSLQHEFNGQIQFVLVNPESKDSTERFFARRKKLHKPLLPMITGDTVLQQIFVHEGKPFHVWIDEAGVVRYMSNGYNSTANNIAAFLAKNSLSIKDKSGKRKVLNPALDTAYQAKVVYSSLLTKCIDGRRLGYGKEMEGRLLNFGCSSIEELYKMAYDKGMLLFTRPGRVKLEVKDTYRYVFPTDRNVIDAWRNENSYYYEVIVPKGNKEKGYDLMIQDLDRYLGLKSSVEKKRVECIILDKKRGRNLFATKGGKPVDLFFISTPRTQIDDSLRVLINQPFNRFYLRLQANIEHLTGKPFLDETGYTGNTDISISGEVMDNLSILSLNKELDKYGLELTVKKRRIEVLVIRE